MLAVTDLTKTYENGMVRALRGISLTLASGEILAVMGPSGGGKTTLLNILGTLDRPSTGEIHLDGQNIFHHRPLSKFRAKTIGFIFQFHHLIPSLTLAENVETALIPLQIPKTERRVKVNALLDRMGLGPRAGHRPVKTSGGERQRAAIARALVHNPRLILADEPTGNLDTDTGADVMAYVLGHCRDQGISAIITTHNPQVADQTDRCLFLRNGMVER